MIDDTDETTINLAKDVSGFIDHHERANMTDDIYTVTMVNLAKDISGFIDRHEVGNNPDGTKLVLDALGMVYSMLISALLEDQSDEHFASTISEHAAAFAENIVGVRKAKKARQQAN